MTAAAVGSTILTGSGNDTITLAAGDDAVNTGAGSDSVSGTVGAGDAINLGASADSFTFQALPSGGDVDGDTGSDTLVYSLATDLTFDFSVTTGQVIAGPTTYGYSNFENLNAAGVGVGVDLTAVDGAAAGGNSLLTGLGDDIIVVSVSSFSALDVFQADGGGDQLTVNGSGGTVTMQASWTGFETVQINSGAVFVANTTANLAISGSVADDDITVGASSQTVNTSGGDDIIRVTSGTMPSTITAGGDTAGTPDFANPFDDDVIVISGGGAVTFGPGITGVEQMFTGATAVTLVLNNEGYIVHLEGGVNHVVDSGNNVSANDYFVFEDSVGWEGQVVALNAFLEDADAPAQFDILNISAFGLAGYDGEQTDAQIADGFAAGTAVFNTDNQRLYLDLNGDGFFNSGDDLRINLGGVTDLSAVVDLILS
ncbi:MAG: hypothetical protein A3G83_14190 [Betaproteobacteria bacterium RIFCSPLOWO2_12_FULL_68_20]|nr:MAG: hypothetical protein A3G83_14190 [Betaproteobacteria bacterium RIFCSPLOWO2_12_FULL_68_20]